MHTWLHVIEWRATCDADIVAVRDDRQCLSYGELHARIEERAGGWLTLGVRSGDIVGVIAHNSVEYVSNVLALMRLGAIPLLLNWRMPAPELARILDVCRPRAVFADPVSTELVTIGDMLTVVDGNREGGWVPVTDLVGDPGSRPVERLAAAETAVLMHSSGTTGNPKVIPLDHGSLIRSLAGFAIEIGDQRPGRCHLAMMPLFHLAGFAQAMQCFLTGGSLTVHREFDVDRVIDAVADQQINFFTAAPAVLEILVDALEGRRRGADMSSLIEVQYGAAPITPDLLIRAQATICRRFRQIYGSTELQGFLTVLRPEDHRADSATLATAGRITQGWEVRIRTADGTPAAPGEPGELQIRGESLVRGYWGDPEATAASWTSDGWYRSGDLGSVDSDGYLSIVGRTKDMIISGGENVYPAEIERVMAGHPAVREVAVVGCDDPRWGEVPVAFVVAVSDGTQATADDLLAHCRQNLAGFKCPKDVYFVDTLPRNGVGKVVKGPLRERARYGRIVAGRGQHGEHG
ncbi:class I adenylate-forming enzyme family protein [Gordonia sp. SL306]|uniref:class I adenylate-forming enzyme family protein n=1 Tax=Gordonia sp. SL306 TaxID=2995145 RepID=UPI00226D62C4|nr:AMP-binding protein [Gordonia sp. SL306]WAC57925.1 AMP-binding protein [Gordonia sp. SL306]